MPEPELTVPDFIDQPAQGEPMVPDFVDQQEGGFRNFAKAMALGWKVRAAAVTALDRGIDNLVHGRVSGNLAAMRDEFLGQMEAKPTDPKKARGILGAAQVGYQSSATGLLIRGKLPDVVLDPHDSSTKWYDSLVASGVQMVADLPEMIVGGAAGGAAGIETGPGALATAGAGAMAAPTALRESLMLAYGMGDVQSLGDFLSRTTVVLKNTARDAGVGALTGAVGGKVSSMVTPLAGTGAQRLLAGATVAGAEVGTMTVAPALLEGRLPEPEDFAHAAILLVGMKSAHFATGKLMDIYARTGLRPEEVLAKSKNDPMIAEDLVRGADEAMLKKEKLDEVRTDPQSRMARVQNAEAAPGVGADAPVAPAGGQRRRLATADEAFGRLEWLQSPEGIAADDAAPRVYATKTLEFSPWEGGPKSYDLSIAGREIYINDANPAQGERFSQIHVSVDPKGDLYVVFVDSAKQPGVGTFMYREAVRAAVEKFPEVTRESAVYGDTSSDAIARRMKVGETEVYSRKGQRVSVTPAGRFLDYRSPNEPKLGDTGIPRSLQPAADLMAVHDAVPGIPAEPVAAEFYGPPRPVPGEPTPTQVNYRYLNSPDQVNGALAKMSELNVAEIQRQRRGTVSWDETQVEAGKVVAQLLGSSEPFRPREPGTAAGAAELLARKQMLEGAATDMATRAKEVIEAGEGATPEQKAAFLESVTRASMIQAEFLGARAEAGRALNILKETRTTAERAQQIQDLMARFGKDPAELARMMADIDNPESALRFAKEASKATTWKKVMEVWKAGLVSGPVTQVANFSSNLVQLVARPVVDTLAVPVGAFSKGERVHFSEAFSRVAGDISGIKDGLMLAKTSFLEDAPGGKAEVRLAIEGKTGYVVRTPFRALEAADILLRTMHERGELYAQASRMAAKEGFGGPFTREFHERVAELVNNPTEKMLDQAENYGRRMVFKAPLGPAGEAFGKVIEAAPILEVVFPFRVTPANVFKEAARLSPAAPLVGEWRADMAAGGVPAQRAAAELALGTALSGLIASMALDGKISGGGDPDPNKKRVQQASGWQPYSVKIGDKWYSYQRLEPFTSLFGMTADMVEAHKHMTPEEKDKAPRILAAAFANNVTNHTFLQGLANAVDAISQPDRKGPKFLQNLTSSLVPSALGQTAQLMDPYQRETDSIREAVQARIPLLREGLTPQRDPYGEPVPSPDRLAGISPVTTKAQSTDKVRTEAARLGIGAEKAPKSLQLPTAGVGGTLGKVELTPEQRDVFGDVAGHRAYEVLHGLVNSPTWDMLPDIVKEKTYKVAFERTNLAGRAAALTLEERQKEAQRIVTEVNRRLSEPPKPVH